MRRLEFVVGKRAPGALAVDALTAVHLTLFSYGGLKPYDAYRQACPPAIARAADGNGELRCAADPGGRYERLDQHRSA
jgi:hypothetical protein